jgi:hypothetical protein
MIQLIEVQNSNIDIEVSITPEVHTYNIVSGYMSDNTRPYRVAERVMIWLDLAGFLGEVEAIYPPMVHSSPCQYGKELLRKAGFPRFEIAACDNEGMIQPIDDRFIVWLAKGKTIDGQIDYKNVQFLLAGDEIVGIVAHQPSIVK